MPKKIVKRKHYEEQIFAPKGPVKSGRRVEDTISSAFDEIQKFLQSLDQKLSQVTMQADVKDELQAKSQSILNEIENKKKELQQKVYVQNRKLEHTFDELSSAHLNLQKAYKKLQIAHERESLAILGEASARLVHEIKNPLAIIEGFVQLLPKKYEKPEFREKFIETLTREIKRLDGITRQLLSFAKPVDVKKENISLEKFLSEILMLSEKRLKDSSIQVKQNISKESTIFADPGLFKQVIVNLMNNAVSIMKETGGEIIFSSKIEGNYVKIFVANTGPNIAKDKIEKIFKPFFTTRSQGTGLGLAICRNIIERHKGMISVENLEKKGVKFIIQLPIINNGERKYL